MLEQVHRVHTEVNDGTYGAATSSTLVAPILTTTALTSDTGAAPSAVRRRREAVTMGG